MRGDRDMAGRRGWLARAGSALAVAAVVNGVLLALLAAANRLAVPRTSELHATDVIIVNEPSIRLRDRETPPPEPPSEPETREIPEVDLDLPAPKTPAPAPLDLDLNLAVPSVGPVTISVRSTPRPAPRRSTAAEASPAQPSRRGQEKSAVRTVDQLPKALDAPRPRYPRSEQRKGREGVVRVKLLIDERGRVEAVRFLSGGRAFREAVEDVIHRWRFDPAREDGTPVKIWATTSFRFSLN